MSLRDSKSLDYAPSHGFWVFVFARFLCRIWRAQVGRVPLYLLDTNVSQNTPQDRHITDSLYGGDNEMRLQQEMILGIGGLRALHVLRIQPTVCHMN